MKVLYRLAMIVTLSNYVYTSNTTMKCCCSGQGNGPCCNGNTNEDNKKQVEREIIPEKKQKKIIPKRQSKLENNNKNILNNDLINSGSAVENEDIGHNFSPIINEWEEIGGKNLNIFKTEEESDDSKSYEEKNERRKNFSMISEEKYDSKNDENTILQHEKSDDNIFLYENEYFNSQFGSEKENNNNSIENNDNLDKKENCYPINTSNEFYIFEDNNFDIESNPYKCESISEKHNNISHTNPTDDIEQPNNSFNSHNNYNDINNYEDINNNESLGNMPNNEFQSCINNNMNSFKLNEYNNNNKSTGNTTTKNNIEQNDIFRFINNLNNNDYNNGTEFSNKDSETETKNETCYMSFNGIFFTPNNRFETNCSVSENYGDNLQFTNEYSVFGTGYTIGTHNDCVEFYYNNRSIYQNEDTNLLPQDHITNSDDLLKTILRNEKENNIYNNITNPDFIKDTTILDYYTQRSNFLDNNNSQVIVNIAPESNRRNHTLTNYINTKISRNTISPKNMKNNITNNIYGMYGLTYIPNISNNITEISKFNNKNTHLGILLK